MDIGGLSAMRVQGTDQHFGNPFSNNSRALEKDRGLVPAKSIQEAVMMFIDWVIEDLTPISKYNISKKVFVEKLLMSRGAQKGNNANTKTRGEKAGRRISLDGQVYYSNNVYSINKGEFKDLFLKTDTDEIYIGTAPKGSNDFTTDDKNIKFYLQDLNYDRNIWVKQQVNSGFWRNKPIVYYKELGQPSHATALDYIIKLKS
jgi:hypothetical protein